MRNFAKLFVTCLILISIQGCCLFGVSGPEDTGTEVEVQSLKRLEEGEPAPENGYWMNDGDWESMLKRISEIEPSD